MQENDIIVQYLIAVRYNKDIGEITHIKGEDKEHSA